MNKVSQFVRTVKYIIILQGFSLTTIGYGQLDANIVQNSLKNEDKTSSLIGYKISFTATNNHNPFYDPKQGIVISDYEVTWKEEGAFAMKVSHHYEHPAVFSSPRTYNYRPGDYHNGNLIVPRSVKAYVLCTSEKNDLLETYEVSVIDPNGKVIEKGGNKILQRFPVDKPYTSYQFRYYQLSMGRGFSNQLDTAESVKSLPSGLLILRSNGSCGPGLKGKWELTMDPNVRYLIREATFTIEGDSKPMEVIASNGVISKGDVTIAKTGIYKSVNGLELSIEVTDISKVVGTNTLYEEVVSEFNKNLPVGTSIIDLRGDKPVRSTVK